MNNSDEGDRNEQADQNPEEDDLIHSLLLFHGGSLSSWSDSPASRRLAKQRSGLAYLNESAVTENDKWFGSKGVTINSSEFDETVASAAESYALKSNFSFGAPSNRFSPLRTERRSQLLNAPARDTKLDTPSIIRNLTTAKGNKGGESTSAAQFVTDGSAQEANCNTASPSLMEQESAHHNEGRADNRLNSVKRSSSVQESNDGSPPAKKIMPSSSDYDFDDGNGNGGISLTDALSQANFHFDS